MDLHVPGTVTEGDEEDEKDERSPARPSLAARGSGSPSIRLSGILPTSPSRSFSRQFSPTSAKTSVKTLGTSSASLGAAADGNKTPSTPQGNTLSGSTLLAFRRHRGSATSRVRGSLASLASGKIRWDVEHSRQGGADGQACDGADASAWGLLKSKTVPCCKSLNKNRFFQGAMFAALLLALFLPDLWVILDRPDNSDSDIVLTVVAVMFLFELTVQSVGMYRTYVRSFFFYMDVLGLVSLMLDLSYLPIMSWLGGGDGESGSGNAVVLRAARIAKLGARAGRFARLVKLLRFLPGMQDQGASAGAAKRLSARLVTSLSTRVSCLIIVMVILMPLFSMWTFPEVDWSMRAWLDRLETALLQSPDRLTRQLGRFEQFYESLSYYPFRVAAKAGANISADVSAILPWSSRRSAPNRPTNIMRFESDHFECEFNFQRPHQIDSIMSLCLLLVIMFLMVGFSCMLSNSVSVIVLAPLEYLLVQIRQTAAKIFQSVTDMNHNNKQEDDDAEDEEEGEVEVEPTNLLQKEIALLDKVVLKLSTLNETPNEREKQKTDGFQGLSDHDRAMISGLYGGARTADAADEDEDDVDAEEDFEYLVETQRTMVENAGLTLDLLNSWNLNPLELDKARNRAAAMFFVGPHNHGIVFDQVDMSNFLDMAELGYVKTNPYHNWFHAIDVTHCVYRFLQMCSTEEYLSNVERFALLLSAICHDIGHPGVNNGFLIETSHDLALRYNDRSPLENMHCAKLFELASNSKCNVLGVLSRTQFKEMRKVSIEAILHTDNAQHFAMIKEIKVCNEVDSEVFEQSRQLFREDPFDYPTAEVIDVFRQQDTRRLLANVMLHMADISNSIKPFRICRIWAAQVLEEFFAQGDAEKKLGIPVQALNDRGKVNRAFSQVGFIEFLVSPLLFAVVEVLPPMEPHLETMMQNVLNWQQIWLTETKPPPSPQERSSFDDRVKKLQRRLLDRQS